MKLELGFRADIIVENKVLIELKSLEKMLLSTLNKYLRIYASQT
ncbi:MAG TPA: GxxExxY protein [Chitinophagaceae bacterium]